MSRQRQHKSVQYDDVLRSEEYLLNCLCQKTLQTDIQENPKKIIKKYSIDKNCTSVPVESQPIDINITDVKQLQRTKLQYYYEYLRVKKLELQQEYPNFTKQKILELAREAYRNDKK